MRRLAPILLTLTVLLGSAGVGWSADLKNCQKSYKIKDYGTANLTRYRSEFFGRLREVLGQRRGVRVVGDRFVFQSEVLFASGSALLERDGQEQIARLATTLNEISEQIPAEINWVLRVDGHTDTNPIATAQFPSNCELSAARAIAVVKFLVEQGVPANRLAATGFGEFQAIDTRSGEIANRRNRRIEFKLTQR